MTRFARLICVVALALAGSCADSPEPGPGPAPERTYTFESHTDLEALFIELNYTPESWAAGNRAVPRLYLTSIPTRWRHRTAKSLPVTRKKQLFFRLISPGALRANELVAADRARLVKLANGAEQLAPDDVLWLENLAARYRLRGERAAVPEAIEELMLRVDVVPPSLVLAQAAEESGWGTSRFADVGNALFGQWAWDDGIVPLERREEMGEYYVARFETPLDSIRAYMRNLNTHRAYRRLRARRAELRAAGEPPSGWELARTLTSYSERGEDYVRTLHSIMRANNLEAVDRAYLRNMEPITLIPVGDGAN